MEQRLHAGETTVLHPGAEAMGRSGGIALNDGNMVPRLGFGVWRLEDEDAPRVIADAIAAGYRHIDTAQGYGNERGVGLAIRQAGIARADLFVTSKLRTRDMGYESAIASCEASLDRMGLDRLDLFLIHWPLPARNNYVDTWKALVRLREHDRVRSIGVSNFLPEHLDRVIAETGVIPAVNQVELHPHYQQRDLREYHSERGIVLESYSPLGGDGAAVLREGAIGDIARKHGRTGAQVVLRWHVQQGLVALPKSTHRSRIVENAAVFDFGLDDEDMAAIAALDRADGKTLPRPEEMNSLF